MPREGEPRKRREIKRCLLGEETNNDAAEISQIK